MSEPQDLHRRTLLLAAAAGLLAPVAARAQALAGAQQTEAVAAVNRALRGLTRVQGRFVQTNPDGSSVPGAFWLQRPGRMRFEYDSPSPLLMVADGSTVALQDRRLNTVDRYPLRSTPLWFLLKDNPDLAREVNVTGAERRDGLLMLSMRDRRREADGELTVLFQEAQSILQGWSVRDGQGRTTRVQLSGQSSPARIDPRLFILRDPPSRRQR